MKKLFFVLLLVFAMNIDVSAQNAELCFYKVTAATANLRKGPGTNYGRVVSEGGVKCPQGAVSLSKNEIVASYGKTQNGFVKVEPAPGSFPCFEEGWVSLKLVTPAKKCEECNGQGTTGRKCPECNGQGLGYCCQYTGMEPCPKCGYVGYY